MSGDSPPPPAVDPPSIDETKAERVAGRSNSFSQQSRASDDSQTAADFLRDQEMLEADAREALPYSIETCTKILGPLRQNVFACLTCNPAPAKDGDAWKPAGMCYACSVSCHGEHTLVEIFQKRNFTCDCGTSRIPSSSPCTLRINSETNTKGNVHSEEPDANNKYNHNFKNRFCGCECDYDPFEQKGTMFQCLGLGTHESGGCGEDWYHPGCLVGMGPKWYEQMNKSKSKSKPVSKEGEGQINGGALATITEKDENQPSNSAAESAGDVAVEDEDEEPPMPPGFPNEDDFEGFLCYKCVEANPWIKQYAGTPGFLPAIFLEQAAEASAPSPSNDSTTTVASKKRKAEDDGDVDMADAKRIKSEDQAAVTEPSIAEDNAAQSAEDGAKSEEPAAEGELKRDSPTSCKLPNLPAAPKGRFSLFFKEDFREKLCHCSDCYGKLNAHPQLLEEEEVYEPPLSADGASQHGGSTHGSGSLLDRGESALRNMDRVRAIEGVMAYNHLKEQLKPFFKQFAESGKAVGAEDIKAYFAKLRGDEQGIKEAGEAAASSKENGDGEGDGRREQSGY
ncbi:zinc finger, n-recognin [Trichoderma arundinaceum]|uniref:Zinc finger, n-recognin n=1 Tax=Trichoderma arundinaceum TaxID=490622 RepID=A0A395NE75_TRIAR|nr:zinc finger, n-recognin [Trichoderma arundinaceum]